MKVLGLLALLCLSSSAFALSEKAGFPIAEDEVLTSNKEVTYTCGAYTKNTVHIDGSTTDNAPIMSTTRVVQNLKGFVVRPGALYPYPKVLTNGQTGSAGGVAGDPTTLIMKKQNEVGDAYFIIWEFDPTKVNRSTPGAVPMPGAAKHLIVIAHCELG